VDARAADPNTQAIKAAANPPTTRRDPDAENSRKAHYLGRVATPGSLCSYGFPIFNTGNFTYLEPEAAPHFPVRQRRQRPMGQRADPGFGRHAEPAAPAARARADGQSANLWSELLAEYGAKVADAIGKAKLDGAGAGPEGAGEKVGIVDQLGP